MKSFRSYRRIYIFPNRHGFLGFGVFTVALAVAATYQNNLVFMMAFLILSLGLIAILQTARNLRDVEIVRVVVEPNAAGKMTSYRLWIRNNGDAVKYNIDIRFRGEGWELLSKVTKVEPQNVLEISGMIRLPEKRGVYFSRRTDLVTTFPYSLLKSWKRDKAHAEIVVYPSPMDLVAARPLRGSAEDEFSHHRPFVQGDSLRRIDWKTTARVGKPHVRHFISVTELQTVIDYSRIPIGDHELKLSQMAHWMIEARDKNYSFQVILPGFASELGQGQDHFQRCIRQLASAEMQGRVSA